MTGTLVSVGDPDATVTSVAAGVNRNQPYTAPAEGERTDAGLGLARLAIGDLVGATTLLDPLGFTVTGDMDQATGRRYAMAVSETTTARAWGVYLADLSAPLSLCIAVPHPRSDRRCEELALLLWRAVPGSLLAMAAVHRAAADGTADHARNTASVFHHLWTGVVGPRGVPQVQVHGFADASATEQVVVSTGAGPVTPAAVRIADEISATGLITTRNWDGTANPGLDATTNQQGIAADTNGWVWAHVELNRTVRDGPALWQPAMDAIAAANTPLVAVDRPSPGGAGHVPKPVGTANTTGSSRFLAREDHIHRGATDTHTHATPVDRFAPSELTDASTIIADVSRGDHIRITLDVDRTLAPPINGTDGQRVLVEALAPGVPRRLALDPAIRLSTGAAPPTTIAAGRRWFGDMVYLDSVGWVILFSTEHG